MQKLSQRNTCTPTDAQPVCCNCDSELNREEILSDQNLKTCDNSSEVDQAQHTERSLQPKVYVLNCRGKPLMPCSYAKSKRMVRKGAAKVIKRSPFTIQLNFDCENKVQDVTLGIDTGYSNIGFSAVSEKDELISGEVILENGMTKRIQDKAMYRRNRRNRLWYREPRWKNRSANKKEGWLPPSTLRRFKTHISLIKKIKKLLPISKIRIEIANFDIQKIENPDIEGTGYQQGSMYQYRNRIAYLITREKGKCQYCDKEYKKGDGWRLHHIWGKLKNRPQDWALVHESCHKKLHAKHEEYVLQQKKSNSYKDSTFMNIIRKRFIGLFEITYGNITFQNRCDLDLEKSHVNDAFVIAGGANQKRCSQFKIEQKRKNNRCLQLNRKGFKPSIRRQRYSLQPKDLVKINGEIYEVKGIHSYGAQVKLKNSFGNIINKSVKKLDEWKFHQKTLIWRTV